MEQDRHLSHFLRSIILQKHVRNQLVVLLARCQHLHHLFFHYHDCRHFQILCGYLQNARLYYYYYHQHLLLHQSSGVKNQLFRESLAPEAYHRGFLPRLPLPLLPLPLRLLHPLHRFHFHLLRHHHLNHQHTALFQKPHYHDSYFPQDPY